MRTAARPILAGLLMIVVCLPAAVDARPARGRWLPLDMPFGLPFVRVRLEGSRPLWFLVDTGFGTSVVDASRAKSLGLRVEEKQVVPMPGGEVETGRAPGLRLSLPGLDLPGRTLLVVPLAQMQPYVGHDVDGIIGHDVIAAHVVTIDYARRRIRFDPPGGYTYRGRGAAVPVTVVGAEPFVEAAVVDAGRAPAVGRFKIDTGSLDTVGMNKNFVEERRLLEGRRVVEIPGIAAGGETKGVTFRVGAFRLGPHMLPDLVVGATLDSKGFENRADAGTFGAGVLGRFTVVLDYARGRMILEPNGARPRAILDMLSGIWPTAAPPDYRKIEIAAVLAGSPAEAAGLRKGDEIVAFDGRPAAALGLEGVWASAGRREGESVRVRVRRGGELLEVALTLRHLV